MYSFVKQWKHKSKLTVVVPNQVMEIVENMNLFLTLMLTSAVFLCFSGGHEVKVYSQRPQTPGFIITHALNIAQNCELALPSAAEIHIFDNSYLCRVRKTVETGLQRQIKRK